MKEMLWIIQNGNFHLNAGCLPGGRQKNRHGTNHNHQGKSSDGRDEQKRVTTREKGGSRALFHESGQNSSLVSKSSATWAQ
jgi:hypothetical protein